MRRLLWALTILCSGWSVFAAEKVFEFSERRANGLPAGFRSVLGGSGQPGEWKVLQEEVPSLLAPLSPNAPGFSRKPVVAQLSRDRTDERFPILIYEDEIFADFTLTTRFKIVDGAEEQMAGIAFRLQDERNYYYIRASALGGTFAFFKVVDGVRSAPIAIKVPLAKGVWHELTIECRGTHIHGALDGKASLPDLDDKSFNSGKIGFWTKSDSVSYFTDLLINYKPKEILAQSLVKDALKKYPRLLGLQIFAPTSTNENDLRIVASKDSGDVGQPAPDGTADVLAGKGIYYGKNSHSVMVILPLHDWNGDRVAAVKVLMNTFIGQTEKNAVTRAAPIVKNMEARVQSVKDLVQ
jgi:hypothetical protein